MTPQQIQLVRRSWRLVVPIADTAAALFYARLFEIAPAVRPLFKRDLTRQGSMLMATLGGVVASLDRLHEVLPAARNLALRHVAWGVEAEHYDSVGEALLWTLEQGLGNAFTADVRDAWSAAYGALAGEMKAAAYPRDRALTAA